MRTLVDQVEASLAGSHYFLSLFGALAIPDIAGALDSDNGEATGPKYAAWYDQWVPPRASELVRASMLPELRSVLGNLPPGPMTGEVCYRFRCSLMHQGSTQNPKSPFSRILFVEPGAARGVIHNCIADDVLIIDVPLFCKEIIGATRDWLDQVEQTPKFLGNYNRFAHRHASGLAPYVVGAPVVG